MVIAGSQKRVKIHIHTNYPAKLFKMCSVYGNVIDKKVDDMTKQEKSIHHHGASSIAIVTDSGSDLPEDFLKEVDKNLFKLNKNKFDEELEKNPITTSYDIYKKRSDKSFKLLNEIQHPKIIRIYPHKIFCNNKIHNRCVTHSQTDMYYYDNNHLSIKGAELLNDIIMQEIKKIVEND